MALIAILYVITFFAIYIILYSCFFLLDIFNKQTHHFFINNFITVIHTIIISLHHRTYSIFVIIKSYIDHNYNNKDK